MARSLQGCNCATERAAFLNAFRMRAITTLHDDDDGGGGGGGGFG